MKTPKTDRQCPSCAGDPPGHVCGTCGHGQTQGCGIEIVGIIIILIAFAVLAYFHLTGPIAR